MSNNKQVSAVLVNGKIYDSLTEWARQAGKSPAEYIKIRKAFSKKELVRMVFDGDEFEKIKEDATERKDRKGGY